MKRSKRSYVEKHSFEYLIPHVRLGEFDLGGVLYHANYFHLLEETREAWLASLGFPYPTLANAGLHFAIVESNQKFLKPIRYGQALKVMLQTSAVRKSTLSVEYQIYLNLPKEEKQLVHTARTVLAHIQSANGTFRSKAIEPALLKRILEYSNEGSTS